MFYREDWIIKQIETMVAALIDAVFKNKSSENKYVQEQHTVDQLLEENKICESENFIFEAAERRGCADSDFLLTVLRFYRTLNNMSEEELNGSGFSHDEVKEGLVDFLTKYCKDEEVNKIIYNVYLDSVIEEEEEE